MSKFSFKRPSPALVISILALFVALGGSAYAAGKIGTKSIKNNAITAAKIKKDAVTAAKIKPGAVTGAKIDEASLGPVPKATDAVNATNAVNATHAANATNAVNATNATNAVNATNFSRYFTTGIKKAGIGETITLASIGPFTMYGKCEDSGGGFNEATTYMMTSQPKANMDSYEVEYEEFDFEPGEEAELGYYADYDTAWLDGEVYYAQWSAISPDGSIVLEGSAYNGVHVFGAACVYNLTWTNNG